MFKKYHGILAALLVTGAAEANDQRNGKAANKLADDIVKEVGPERKKTRIKKRPVAAKPEAVKPEQPEIEKPGSWFRAYGTGYGEAQKTKDGAWQHVERGRKLLELGVEGRVNVNNSLSLGAGVLILQNQSGYDYYNYMEPNKIYVGNVYGRYTGHEFGAELGFYRRPLRGSVSDQALSFMNSGKVKLFPSEYLVPPGGNLSGPEGMLGARLNHTATSGAVTSSTTLSGGLSGGTLGLSEAPDGFFAAVTQELRAENPSANSAIHASATVAYDSLLDRAFSLRGDAQGQVGLGESNAAFVGHAQVAKVLGQPVQGNGSVGLKFGIAPRMSALTTIGVSQAPDRTPSVNLLLGFQGAVGNTEYGAALRSDNIHQISKIGDGKESARFSAFAYINFRPSR